MVVLVLWSLKRCGEVDDAAAAAVAPIARPARRRYNEPVIYGIIVIIGLVFWLKSFITFKPCHGDNFESTSIIIIKKISRYANVL
jgi:hypothetical protein